MSKITITIDGRAYQHDASPEEFSGLTRSREAVMADLPRGDGQRMDTPPDKRPGYVADDVEYLQSTVAEWAARKGADEAEVQACMERCLRSWARIYAA